MSEATAQSPFGTHALPARLEKLRRWSLGRPASKANRRIASMVRRICLAGREDPIDVVVFSHGKARLFPRSNRCEKAIFAGEQFWDLKERQALAAAIGAAGKDPRFIFLDLGANVGLYSIFVAGEAEKANRPVRILAVEPDPTNRARLELNLALSGVKDVTIAATAIGGEAGSARLAQPARNRGEVRLVRDGGEGESVAVATLPQLLAEHEVERIDAMKIDIEGEDEAAMRTFFSQTRRESWPRVLIAETGRKEGSPLIASTMRHGYRLVERAGINSIFRLDEARADAQAEGGA